MGVDIITQDHLETLLEANFESIPEMMHLDRLCDRAAALKQTNDDDIIVLCITAYKRTKGGRVAPLQLSPMQSKWKMALHTLNMLCRL